MPVDDVPTLETAARGISEAAVRWRAVFVGLGVITGVGMIGCGLVYSHRKQSDPRLSWLPAFMLPLAGCGLAGYSLTWTATRTQLFAVPASYTYSATAGHHPWEIALINATADVVTLIGTAVFLWGLKNLGWVGYAGWQFDRRLSISLAQMLFGFLLAEYALVLSATLHQLGFWSPFS
jgi:hypothetical protein